MKLLCRYKYNTLAAIREVQCPVLIVHSQEDEIVPFRHGRKLFDAADDPRVFLEISGSHNEGFITSSSVYINGLKAFLDRIDVYFSSHQKALAWGRKRVDVRMER